MNEQNIAEPRLSPGREVFFPYFSKGKEDVGRKNGSLHHFIMAVGTVKEVNKYGQVIIEHDGGIYNRPISNVFIRDEINDLLIEDPNFVVKGIHDIVGVLT